MNIIFNNLDLQADPYFVTDFNKEFELSSYTENNSLGDGVKLISQNTRNASFSIKGVIKGTDRADLDDNIDSFLGSMYSVYATASSSYLNIDWAGSTRLYRCGIITAPKIIREAYQINYCDFELELLGLDGFGIASTDTIQSYTGITTTSSSHTYTFAGEVSPIPNIKIQLNSGTDVSKFTIKNNTTNTQLEISYNFTGTELINIDIENSLIQINGVNASWEGVYPQFLRGSNTLTYAVISTSHNYDITYTYRARYT